MKIIHLITRLIRGGAQRIALTTVEALREHGVEAALWCGPETGPEGSLREEAASRGVPLRVFPDLVRSIDPRRDLRALRALRQALLEEKPDWVHTHSSKAGIVGREAARRAGVAGIVHTVHGWGFTQETPLPLRKLYVELERRAGQACRRLIFVSPSDRVEGEALGIVPTGVGVDVPPGIDLAPYTERDHLLRERRRIRRDFGLDEETVVGGFLGRLAPQKDPATMLAVARLLRPSSPRLRWLVVGDGPLGRGLKESCDRNPALAGIVHWAGLQAEPAPFLAAMDFLIFPSRWEGTPLTLMEAMAAGLPCVASDLPGVRFLMPPAREEARDPADPILLTQPGDASGFATCIMGMLSNPSLMQRMKAETRYHAHLSFGLPRMLAQLLQIYGVGQPG